MYFRSVRNKTLNEGVGRAMPTTANGVMNGIYYCFRRFGTLRFGHFVQI
jgi:hypothetical protein